MARPGVAWHGAARQGAAGRGLAWRGMAGLGKEAAGCRRPTRLNARGEHCMARICVTLTGSSPLLCHNIRLADPDDPIVKQIAELTGKRTKTEEDRRAIGRLEWFGGLYTAPGIEGPAMPTANIRKCFIRGGTIHRLGTQIGRALFFVDAFVAIQYPGPRDLDELFPREEFTLRTLVGVSQARTLRTRPRFQEWRIQAPAELVEDALDFDDLIRAVESAGVVEGLGDFRIGGYGRFTAKVERQ
jgi:hypothetical protein